VTDLNHRRGTYDGAISVSLSQFSSPSPSPTQSQTITGSVRLQPPVSARSAYSTASFLAVFQLWFFSVQQPSFFGGHQPPSEMEEFRETHFGVVTRLTGGAATPQSSLLLSGIVSNRRQYGAESFTVRLLISVNENPWLPCLSQTATHE
jgi:hypothetical protein